MIVDIANITDKTELFDYLRANKDIILAMKKAEVKSSDFVNNFAKGETVKAVSTDNEQSNTIERKIIANTYGWMDSHSDVHLPGIFTKSLQESKSKVLFLHDHEYKLGSKVGKFNDVVEESIAWNDLGVNKHGNTISLVGYATIDKELNSNIFTQYKRGEIQQHSVGMIYVKLSLCINDMNDKEHFANWLQYLPFVANSDKANEQGYFFAIHEAKLKEISCVIAGSNELTPTIEPTKTEPLTDTQEKATQNEELINIINNFNFI